MLVTLGKVEEFKTSYGAPPWCVHSCSNGALCSSFLILRVESCL